MAARIVRRVSCEHLPWSKPQEAGLKPLSIQMFHVILNILITCISASQVSCSKVVTHTARKLYLLRLKFYHFFQSLHARTHLPTQARRLSCQITIPSTSTTVISHCHQTPKAFYGKDFYNMDWFLWSPISPP